LNGLAAAVDKHQRGDLAGAETAYRSLINSNPAAPEPHYYLGVLMLQKGDALGASRQIGTALGLGRLPAEAYANQATALRMLGRHNEALASLEQAIKLNPAFVGAIIARGNMLLDFARPDDALDSFLQALRLVPEDPHALNGVGLVHLARGRPTDALDAFERGLRSEPQAPWLLVNRAVALTEAGRPLEGLAACDIAYSVASRDPALSSARGNALFDLERFEEAVAAYDAALALDPRRARDWDSRGMALMTIGRQAQALSSFQQALSAQGTAPERISDPYKTRLNLCTLLRELGREDEAATAIAALYADAPEYPFVRGHAFRTGLDRCAWRGFDIEQRAVITAVASGTVADQPWNFLGVSDDPALQLACARSYAAERGYAPVNASWNAERSRRHSDRIRIAYLSSDFREHATMYLAAGLFEAHDRTRFETTAVSFSRSDNSTTQRRVRSAFERFIDAHQLTDAEVSKQLRSADIDIAVDLHGFAGGARPKIFASRPAPLQVSFLGYPGSMGVDWIDYLIADDVVVPEEARSMYSEAIVRIPHCYQVNDSARPRPSPAPARAALGLPDQAFVFASFSPPYKINPPLFDAWMAILKAAPGSVLWLLAKHPDVSRNLRAEASSRGVDPTRLCFSPPVGHLEFLTRLSGADLFLDTFPVCAHTTASDALWAGLPLIALSGRAFASRVSTSLLVALGLADLVTASFEDYTRLAIELATSPERLAVVRRRLEESVRRSPVFDSRVFCRHLESAFVTMWQRQQAGVPPASFSVPKEFD
jgi:predicted O-linked N-acetylglucosamine transferase (SPINDLY family)